MGAPLIPWAPSNIPSEIQDELNRRKVNRSFNFVPNAVASWDKDNKWNSYRGPMVSWLRICSNGYGKRHKAQEYDMPRFVLYGGKDFYQTYGFQPVAKGSGKQIIGYTPDGKAHIIENMLSVEKDEVDVMGNKLTGNYPIHIPSPEVSRLDVTIQKELFRRANIEWVCFSWKQLEYLTPYFLVPGISVMVEWGWNHFNPASMVDLTNVNGKEPNMKSLWNNAYPLYTDNILKSRGNYDVIYGIITNFNWSVEGNKIICSTEITSKDRIYAGISNRSSLKANTNKKTGENETEGILMSVYRFFESTDVGKSFARIAASKDPNVEASNLGAQSGIIKGHGIGAQVFPEIISRLTPSATTTENERLKYSYIHGVFYGRDKNDTDAWLSARPAETDFDKAGQAGTDDKIWLNMGLVVEILNYFSSREGVEKRVMFEVDITGTIIGAHPNLISCDTRVLIPNYMAPKYHYGRIGQMYDKAILDDANVSYWGEVVRPITSAASAVGGAVQSITAASSGPTITYGMQAVAPPAGTQAGTSANLPDTKKPPTVSYSGQYAKPLIPQTPYDEAIGKYLYQKSMPKVVDNPAQAPTGFVYRNNLDKWINWFRYARPNPKGEKTTDLKDFSFPAKKDFSVPLFSKDANGNPKKMTMIKDWSGLLSNIYISFQLLRDTITDSSVNSYWDIYNSLLEKIMAASDEYWDLALTEAEGKMTIVDRKYVSKDNFDGQNGDTLWVFDYYDSDSLIKSLKFRPAMTDAQATRAIYGSTSNPNAKWNYSDKNDLVNFTFKDAVILPVEDLIHGVPDGALSKRTAARDLRQGLEPILIPLQKINDASEDTFQMTIPSGNAKFPYEVIKLVMPDQELLGMILDDGDKANNQRYCAIQPGIVAEITLLGVGGLRTFQYFMIRNLPEPYSHNNIIFRIIDVVQHIEAGNWETTIRAGLLPLADYIKFRVTPKGGWEIPPKSPQPQQTTPPSDIPHYQPEG